MSYQNAAQNGLAGAISSAIAPVLTQAQTGLIEDVNDTFGGQGSVAATPVTPPATPSTPTAPSLTTPQPAVQPGFQPAMPIIPSRGGLGDSNILMKLLENQRQMREQMDFMNRVNQSPFSGPLSGVSSPFPRSIGGVFGGTRLASDVAEPQSGPQYPAQMLAAGGKTEARAVQSQGRGEDSMLVHMTPGEVAGLQALAMQHGGSLTINPDTGLPEAGFLKSLLPTLIGVGLAATGIGAPMAGLMVGGFEAARTGDIGKGLMAGLGAYGGAGLGAGLQSAGSAANLQAATYDKALAAPTTLGGRLAEMGTGFSNLTGMSGTAGSQAAAQAAATKAGLTGTGLAMKSAAALAGPLSQPAPMPEVEKVEYNYDGPYRPTKREVVYPGEDRDPNDSSEFLYFPNTNPVPYAEGGTSVATAPPEGYVAGRDAEFVYGFQPMSTDMPVVQETARASRGIDAIAPAPDAIRTASITVSGGDGGDNNTGPGVSINDINRSNDYGYDYPSYSAPSREDEQQSRAAAAAAAAMGYAMGGKTMDHGGFVVDAHTVSEIGNGSSDAGHSMLARIGGEPIKGAGNGTSDSIRANIGGVQEARIAKDENYFSKEDVKRLGGGNYKKGEKKLYALMRKAHESRKKNGRGQASGLDKLVARMG